MKAHSKPGWALTEDQRRELWGLMADVDPEDGEHAPSFIRLLEAWERCRAPWNIRPLPPAYRCKGGVWLVESVEVVVGAIRRHVED